jgi:hypothetical protein
VVGVARRQECHRPLAEIAAGYLAQAEHAGVERKRAIQVADPQDDVTNP